MAPCEILGLESSDEISSGEEDETTLPPNYRFYSDRIADSNHILKKLKRINRLADKDFKTLGEGIKRAQEQTLL